MTDGFTMFAVDSPRTVLTIKKKLNDTRDGWAKCILAGEVLDWANYQRMIGILYGIDEALRLCEEIEQQERN